MKYDCILLAAGEGQRAALGYNKVLYKLNGKKEILLYSFEFFLNDPNCAKVILVINERDKNYIKHVVNYYNSEKVVVTFGGQNRGDSVAAGLELAESEYVLVHDSARPLVYKEDINLVLEGAKETGGAALATRVYNTTCLIENGYVQEYFSRHKLASIITPQCFLTSKLKECYEKAHSEGTKFTDDSGIFKAYAGSVKLVFTDNISIKATTSYDIKLLEVMFDAHRIFN